MFEPIRNQIKSRLATITTIQEVLDYPTETFNGFPVAMIASTRNESDFETTIQNKRTYVFTIYLLQEIENKGERQSRRIIESVVDDVMESFDQDQQLSGISLPSNESILITQPMLSQIYVSTDTKYVVGELLIKVVVSFSIN